MIKLALKAYSNDRIFLDKIKWNYLVNRYASKCLVCGHIIPEGELCEWLMNNGIRHFRCGEIYDLHEKIKLGSFHEFLNDNYEDSRKMYKKSIDVLTEINIASGGSELLSKLEKPKILMNKWSKIEDVRTEFKSSWQFDIRFDEIKKRGKPGAIDEYKKRNQGMEKILKEEVVETVCSFLNTEGGSIWLGVSDSGEAIGLEKDLAKFLKPDKNSKDVLRQDIKNSIAHHIRPMTSEINFEEHKSDSKYVLEIKVRALRENEDPAFMKIDNKNKILIVREMEGDVKYYDQEKQLQYVRKRFPNYLKQE